VLEADVLRHLRLSLVLTFLAAPSGAGAQGQWDVAGIAGLFAAHSPEPQMRGYHEDWFHTGQGGVIIGRHFTPNLKLEFEAMRTGNGTQHIERYVSIPGYAFPYPVGSKAHKSIASIGTTVTWQFFENQWAHPFVQAGVAAEFDRRVVNTWAQQFYSGDPRQGGTVINVAERRIEGPDTTTAARAVVGGGVKMYVSPRLFVRTDGRAALSPRRQHVSFRIGFGADF
jgi:hypothetical protein